MQTGWRLERTYLAGAGYPESRLEGLDIPWSDPLEASGHAALWADNGTGKTTITALRFALYLPHARDFVRGDSDRSLARLVHSGRVCHVVEQATREINGELQRLVAGMVAHWEGGAQDLGNASKLHRSFYGWVTGPDGPSIDNLPFRADPGRWTTYAQFTDAIREIAPKGGVLPAFIPSGRQAQWGQWLAAADVDLTQMRFQAAMNGSEGGVDNVMRFADSDAFIRWLIGAITPTSTVEQIARSIEVLRDNSAARPGWTDELAFWERVIDPLLRLAVVHEEAEANRRKASAARTAATGVIADADATTSALTARKETDVLRHGQHEQRRKEASALLRRAQAHRLRMQLRAAKLRADEAEAVAAERRQARDQGARELAAWQLVADVLDARQTAGALAGMTERLDAAEQETAVLRQQEQAYRHQLARLLTSQRDKAAAEFAEADGQRRQEAETLRDTDKRWRNALQTHATAVEQERKARQEETESERAVAAAVEAGVLPEGTAPAAHDEYLARQSDAARGARDEAAAAIRDIDSQAASLRERAAAARRRADTARADAGTAQRQHDEVAQRVDAITGDERFLDFAGTLGTDVWSVRVPLTDVFQQAASTADTDAAHARADAARAQRTISAVGEDGLLPGSVLAEEMTRTIRESEDIPVWTGWRWLADTQTPEAAAEFAAARPEIASGLVLGQPTHLDTAMRAAGTAQPDTALWIGAVVDSDAALNAAPAAGTDGTIGQLLLPHPGTYDRAAAGDMLAAAQDALTEATRRQLEAAQRATAARGMLAALTQLWSHFPDDPRPALAEKIGTAKERQHAAETEEQDASGRLAGLAHLREEQGSKQDEAQQTIDDATETRRLLAPAVTASAALSRIREQLPALRLAVSEAQRRAGELERRRSETAKRMESAADRAREHARNRDNSAEKLREAGLTATSAGPVPEDDEPAIRARLDAVKDAIAEKAIDPQLHGQVKKTQQHLADLSAKLDADPEVRRLAEDFADSDGARHPIAVRESIRQAAQREAAAREESGRATATAEAASSHYRQRAEDRSADRTSPDAEGFPADRQVSVPADADRIAEQLDELATAQGTTLRTEEKAAQDASHAVQAAVHAMELIEASAHPLRHLADASLSGQPASDTAGLLDRLTRAAERLRSCDEALAKSLRSQEAAAGSIRAQANSTQARKVEEGGNPHVADLVRRLRGDAQLPGESEHLAGQLEQRAASLRDDLERHDQNVRACAKMLHLQATTAIHRLRAYQNQSQLPEGLGNWSQRQFVIIDHEPQPDDESVAIDRVARVVHSLLEPNASRSDAESLLFAAARALVEAPFRVRLLKPHTDLSLDRVDVAELKNFSCGQRVTAGVLLYAAMTRVRAAGDAASIGWLWLDNPFGQASADSFVRTMRRAADQLGLQLVFTAAPKDKGALSMFDRTIALARRTRPSSKEKVVVVDDGSREIADLLLIQKDVVSVLGE